MILKVLPSSIVSMFLTFSNTTYFGLLFSLMELGQENNPVAIHRDRLYTFPVGMIFGGLVGVANYFSAVRSSTYDPLDINMA